MTEADLNCYDTFLSTESNELPNATKKDFIFFNSLRETGYYFDDDGILRYVKDNSYFPFKSHLIPFFKVRYDIFRTLTAKYVREMLNDIGVISETFYTKQIPCGIRILHSIDFQLHKGPLLVIIQAGGVTRSGVWSSRLLMHSSGGLNVASHIPQIKKALNLNYGILIINPSEKVSRDDLSPEEIIHSIWSNLIPKCQSNRIIIWAHMYGGTAFLHSLQPAPNVKSYRKNMLSYDTFKKAPNIIESYDSYLTRIYNKHLNQYSKSSNSKTPTNDHNTPQKSTESGTDDSMKPNNSKTSSIERIEVSQDINEKDKKSSKSSIVNKRNNKSAKKRSVASNNATDNSSLQSDISMLAPKLKYNKLKPTVDVPNETDMINGTSESELETCLNDFQNQINKVWEVRRGNFWNSLKQKVVAIAFTDSAICLKMQGIIDKEVHEWFKQNAVHYVACVEPIGVELNKNIQSPDNISIRSAGTAEHDIIPHLVTDNVFDFFNAKLEGRNKKIEKQF